MTTGTTTGTATTTAGPGVPALDLDPFAEEFLDDPYPAHHALREAGPVVRLERYGVWGLARHASVAPTLADWQSFSSGAGVGLSDFTKEKPWRTPSLLLETDPPAHTASRHVITRVLSPKVVRGLKETFSAQAEQLVEEVLSRAAAGDGTVDGVADLAEAFPLRVFPDAVGIAEEGRDNLLPYGNMAFNAFGPRNALFERAFAEAAPVTAWIAEQCERSALSDDGLGALVYASAAQEGMTEEQAGLLVRSLLTAGVDTTVHGLGNALYSFTLFPDQWALLHADPSMARAAFEESVRFESPVQTFFRTTTRPVEIEGVPIPAGEKVLMFLAAANRDPRQWADPDRFDVRRRANGHVGFGNGIHACVGQMVARLEAEVLLGALARRVAAIERAGPPVRKLNNTLRGLEHLPVRLTPA